jgi:hypothetical protein
MNRVPVPSLVIAALLGVLAIAPKVTADELDQKVIATFDKPVEVPGNVVLEPGTYLFKLRDPESLNHVVIIESPDGHHTYATVLGMNDYRTYSTGKPQFLFGEVPAGQPARLKAMYYPGENYGQEFIYQHK